MFIMMCLTLLNFRFLCKLPGQLKELIGKLLLSGRERTVHDAHENARKKGGES